jgi:hypothetical protein
MIIANTVLISNGGKAGTHALESWVDLFHACWIVLEMNAVLAEGPGTTRANGIRNVHALMRYNVRPVMTENDYRKDISQNYVYYDSNRKRDKGFDTCTGQFAKSCGQPDT